MDEEPENTPRNRGNTSTSAVTHTSGHLLTSETMNRTADRTCNQKLAIPTLDKQDHTSANMWWRKFVQYIKMTKEIDLSTMNNKEILPQFRDQLELEIRQISMGNWTNRNHGDDKNGKRKRTKLTTVTRTIHIIPLFRLHFTPERNVQHSRADFFDLKKEMENPQQMYGNES